MNTSKISLSMPPGMGDMVGSEVKQGDAVVGYVTEYNGETGIARAKVGLYSKATPMWATNKKTGRAVDIAAA